MINFRPNIKYRIGIVTDWDFGSLVPCVLFTFMSEYTWCTMIHSFLPSHRTQKHIKLRIWSNFHVTQSLPSVPGYFFLSLFSWWALRSIPASLTGILLSIIHPLTKAIHSERVMQIRGTFSKFEFRSHTHAPGEGSCKNRTLEKDTIVIDFA